MLKGFVIIAIFLLPNGDISRVARAANPEVFDTKTECEEELNNSLTRGYEKIENIGSEQVFYKRAIGDFTLNLTCMSLVDLD